MDYKTISDKRFTGERAAFGSVGVSFENCVFEDGESPLKESKNLKLKGCSFGWKYPLWYCHSVEVEDTKWLTTGRSGVWYTHNLVIKHSKIDAPKQFRRCTGLTVINCSIPHAEETLWDCDGVHFEAVEVKGDYFGMNSRNIKLKGLKIDGNYCFDGGKNITAKDCIFNSKDAFWNCENVVIEDSVIIGEYFGWNSKNITLINCKIESHQGFCYIEGLKLINCGIFNSDLCFEFCSDIDIQLSTKVDSVKNPINGRIQCKGIGELIMDKSVIDPDRTVIEVVEDV